MNLQCAYQNVRGLNTKLKQFYVGASYSDYDLVAVTETWCGAAVSDTELIDANLYTVYRQDRNFSALGVSRGGGVLLAVRNNISSTKLDLGGIACNLASVDIVGSRVSIGSESVYVFVVYIQPQAATDDYLELFDYLESLTFLHGSNIMIYGDFNIPNYVDSCSCDIIGDARCNILSNFLNYLDLKQYNTVLNNRGRILDMVLSNLSCTVHGLDCPLVSEDAHHPFLLISIDLCATHTATINFNSSVKKYNFRKANFAGLYSTLACTDWSFLDSFKDVNCACESFYSRLYSILDTYVPVLRVDPNKEKFPMWYNSRIIKKLKQKNQFWRKYRKTSSGYYYNSFKILRAELDVDIGIAYRAFVEAAQNRVGADPGSLWSFVNARQGHRRLPCEMSDGNQTFDTPQMIVDGFATVFQGVYINHGPVDEPPSCNEGFSYFCGADKVTEDELLRAVKRLKNKMTAGYDLVPSFLVKDCVSVLCVPLLIIYNLIISTSVFPELWKVGRVCPLFKKGDRDYILNYRPITVLSNFSKVLEVILHQRIYRAVAGQISSRQHGFVPGRSTVTNLTLFSQFISECLDDGVQVDVVFTDFSRAFDVVNHNILIEKAVSMGVSMPLIRLLKSYLHNRYQYVEYLGFQSRKFSTLSGVPQGSNLGPLLFTIFVNEICQNMSSNYLIYADDVKIFRRIDDVTDCDMLQEDLCKLSRWCSLNGLYLNVTKCKVLSFSRRCELVQRDYMLGGESISRCTGFRDLGVEFDPKLSFNLHIGSVVSRSIRLLGFIIRSCGAFDPECLRLLYVSCVRPTLEYASVVWSPFYTKYIDSLETVQRKFLKYLAYRADGVYPERGTSNQLLRERFCMESLESRRCTASVVTLYKVMSGTIDSPELLECVKIMAPGTAARRHRIFSLPRARTNLMLKSPIYVMLKLGNCVHEAGDIFYCNLSYLSSFDFSQHC